MKKFPKIVSKKWKRYNKFEKVFIIYLFLLAALEVILPFLKIEWINYSFINLKFTTTSMILLFSIAFLIARNVSFTVKWIIKSIFGFYENEAIANFWILLLHATLLIYTKDIISILAYTQSAELYKLNWWYYFLWGFIIIWLIWNLFLAISNSSLLSSKRTNYSKIIWIYEEENKTTSAKSLFENR